MAEGPRSHIEQLLEARLEETRDKLRQQLRATVDRERQLGVLSTFSARLAQAKERQQVVDIALDLVKNVIGVEVVFIFAVVDDRQELMMVGSRGLSPEFTADASRIKVGEGINGFVARSGQSTVIQDASCDDRIRRAAVRIEQLQTMVVVPLVSRRKIVGTLGVSSRKPRVFMASEVDLLETLGNQIGIAMENCRLYGEQLRTLRRLQISEKKYRLLFENAHAAIWVTDLAGIVVAVNKACAKMLERDIDDIIGRKALEFFSWDHPAVDRGEFVEEVHDQRLERDDGSKVILKVATTSVVIDGSTVGFQHIAKDITEERRMHDNLRFYVQQVTNAQEEERLRIARELHDSTAQTLIALLHQMESYLDQKKGMSMSDSRLLWSLQEQIKSALHEVRQFSRDLRPSILDDLGLLPALEWLVEELRKHHGIEGKLSVFGRRKRFTPEVELLLFRIVQEALRNIVRHAEASRAEVTLVFTDDDIKITIKDNGQGMELPVSLEDLPRVGKLGLAGMRERAQLLQGSVSIESSPGRGTIITIKIPVGDY